jgi:hypothetical protein
MKTMWLPLTGHTKAFDKTVSGDIDQVYREEAYWGSSASNIGSGSFCVKLKNYAKGEVVVESA